MKQARETAGFKSARDAALSNGWPESSYRAHENGTRTIGQDDAIRYARRFGNVTAEFILFGPTGSARAAVDPVPARNVLLPKPDASFPIPMQFPPRMLPVFGQAAGGMNEDGRFILNGQKVADVFCPPALTNVVGAYGIYISGESMAPRYEHGELLLIHPGLPVSRGNYVLAQIQGDDGDPPYGYVKKFISKNAKELVLEQLNPPEGQDKILRFPAERVIAVHRVFSAGMG